MKTISSLGKQQMFLPFPSLYLPFSYMFYSYILPLLIPIQIISVMLSRTLMSFLTKSTESSKSMHTIFLYIQHQLFKASEFSFLWPICAFPLRKSCRHIRINTGDFKTLTPRDEEIIGLGWVPFINTY